MEYHDTVRNLKSLSPKKYVKIYTITASLAVPHLQKQDPCQSERFHDVMGATALPLSLPRSLPPCPLHSLPDLYYFYSATKEKKKQKQNPETRKDMGDKRVTLYSGKYNPLVICYKWKEKAKRYLYFFTYFLHPCS